MISLKKTFYHEAFVHLIYKIKHEEELTFCILSPQSRKWEKNFLFMTLARANTHRKLDHTLLLQLVWASNLTASSFFKSLSIQEFLMDIVKKCISAFSKVWDNDKKMDAYSIVCRKRMVWIPVLCISRFSLKLGFSQCFGHLIRVSAKIINNGRQRRFL